MGRLCAKLDRKDCGLCVTRSHTTAGCGRFGDWPSGFEESRIAERQRLGPGEMIIANPTTGTLSRGEILKRLATQQSRRLRRRPAGLVLPRQPLLIRQWNRLTVAAPALVGRSVQNSFSGSCA